MPKLNEILKDNNESVGDWITWETLGNPSDKYQKGDLVRSFGLWRADYTKLCKEGDKQKMSAPIPGALGRGWVQIHALQELDYREHQALIQTFLPCFKVDQYGSLVDPLGPKVANFPQGDLIVVFPYNYDDNSGRSAAMGTDLDKYAAVSAQKLASELPRWSTASRSCIVPLNLKAPNVDVKTTADKSSKFNWWPFRDAKNAGQKIMGDYESRGVNFEGFKQKAGDNFTFYSVKTGVQFVATQDQAEHKAHIESNSVQAMTRSDLILWQRKNYAEKPATRFQLEILLVRILTDNGWDGFQIRELGDGTGQIWFPALAIPKHGKPFAQRCGANDWAAFWEESFAKPLGRARAELMSFFGLQLMGNAQNMLVAFDRSTPGTMNAQIIIRDIGDALLNDHFYETLTQVDAAFAAFETAEGDNGARVSTQQGDPNDTLPLMTRLGVELLFLFGPFMEGDLSASTAPHVTLRWVLAHNRAFAAELKTRLGFEAGWQDDDKTVKPANNDDLIQALRVGGIGQMKKRPTYDALVKTALEAASADRWRVLQAIEQEIEGVISAWESQQGGQKASADEIRILACMHDVLLCADLQGYILSAKGSKALKEFHANARAPKQVQKKKWPVVQVNTGAYRSNN